MKAFKIIFGILAILITLHSVLAVTSSEQIVVRLQSYDPSTRAYTFTCDVPAGAGTNRYWTLRPDTPDLEAQTYTTTRTVTFTLDRDVMYHIGCQVPNANGTYIRGDFHIDRRTAPNTVKPNIVEPSNDATQFTATCMPPQGTTHYSLYWREINAFDNIALNQFTNQNTITTTVPHAGLWDVTCGVWDYDKSAWTQWGYPTEFFTSGPAYTPRLDGCAPDVCPGGSTPPPTPPPNSTNTTNTTVTCSYNGKTYNPGDSFPAGDTCNTCSCGSNGQVMCTQRACTNQTNQTNQTCFVNIQNIPASCSGNVTSDVFNGCRTITCGGLQVQACDKPDGQTPQYFEMYRQSGTGNLCIGNICLGNSGFVRSGNYPICIGNTTQTPPPNPPPNNSTNTTNTTGVIVSIAKWYPQGHNYVFICNANASSYDWNFGDGQQQSGMTSDNVYHTFMNTGSYTVTCNAGAGSGSLGVTVG